MSQAREALARVRALDLAFRNQVEAGDWAGAQEAEAERREALQCLFEAPQSPEMRRDMLVALHDMLSSDRALLSQLQAARDECAQELRGLNQGQRVSALYLQQTLERVQ